MLNMFSSNVVCRDLFALLVVCTVAASPPECIQTTFPYNSSRAIRSTQIVSLIPTQEVRVTFDLNVTSDAFRVLIGVTPFSSLNISATQGSDDCIQPLNQIVTPSPNASVVVSETCFYGQQLTSGATNASMHVIILRCGSDVVVSRHVAAVTVNHFLRGTSEFITYEVEGFVCEFDDAIGPLRVGALDPIDATSMDPSPQRIIGFPPFNDYKYRVVVGLNRYDCDSLEDERDTFDDSSMHLSVESDSLWNAHCNLSSEYVTDPDWFGFAPDYFDDRRYCYCVLEEPLAGTWEFFTNYVVHGIIADHENVTSSLVGQTTTGWFSVCRSDVKVTQHDQADPPWWIGLIVLLLLLGLGLGLFLLTKRSKNALIGTKPPPWHNRLRVPRFFVRRMD